MWCFVPLKAIVVHSVVLWEIVKAGRVVLVLWAVDGSLGLWMVRAGGLWID